MYRRILRKPKLYNMLFWKQIIDAFWIAYDIRAHLFVDTALDDPRTFYNYDTISIGCSDRNVLSALLHESLDDRVEDPDNAAVLRGFRVPTGKVAVSLSGTTCEAIRAAGSVVADYVNPTSEMTYDFDGTVVHIQPDGTTEVVKP